MASLSISGTMTRAIDMRISSKIIFLIFFNFNFLSIFQIPQKKWRVLSWLQAGARGKGSRMQFKKFQDQDLFVYADLSGHQAQPQVHPVWQVQEGVRGQDCCC